MTPSDPITRLNAALGGRYRVESKIGEGGMATVYLAEDLRHERKVALKVLKPELAAVVGADRFLAEIKTTANLQHPHILPLFDSGQADSFLYFVMPYVVGDTLRDRIDREKQLPVEEALDIARKVASALDYAHEHGVVHRDIKPGNILLSERGEPTVADFGIALAVAQAGGGRVTETGLSLGTPHYMSPEQATGDRDVDPRTDVYALGCVLYEMLTGGPPYEGSTAQAVLAKILTDEAPAPTKVRLSIPANVDAAIRKALEKLPADRFAAAQDFARALGDPAFRHGAHPGDALRTHGLWNPLSVAATAIALLLGLFQALTWLASGSAPGSAESYAMDVALPSDQLLSIPTARAYPFDVSPDGRALVYAGIREGVTRLYVRRLDDFDFVELAGTEGARQPFYSWDGSQIGFFAGGRLMRVPVGGGTPIFVAETPGHTVGASWGPENIVFARAGELFQVSPSGGEPEPLQLEGLVGEASNQLAGFTWPSHLPGGEHLLVTAAALGDQTFVFGSASGEVPGTGGNLTFVVGLSSGDVQPVVRGTQGQYLATGHILFYGGGQSVRAIAFDLRSRRTTGDAFPLIDNVFRGAAGGAAFFRAGRSGGVAYVRGGLERSLVLVDRTGRETQLTPERRGFRLPHFSPDGSQVAVGVDPNSDLWLYDVATGRGIELNGGGINSRFHPDGRLFAGAGGFAERRPEGGPPPIVEWPRPPTWASSWTNDGGTLIVQDFGLETGYDVHALQMAGDTVLVPLLVTAADEDEGRLSPDAGWMAYESNRSGQDEIYVAAYPEMTGTQQVSLGGGKSPLWSYDGSELFYRSGDRVMAVAVSTGPTLSFSTPEMLFQGDYDHSQNLNWDVDPSGRFVMVRTDPGTFRQFRVLTSLSGQLPTGP